MNIFQKDSIKPACLAIVLTWMLTGSGFAKPAKAEPIHFEPTIESLRQHQVPEWFKDAKFGIYAHWGVPAVPGFESEWYPKRMYSKGSKAQEYHTETYGHPSEFGYSKFIPMFKAEKFDADEWAEIYYRAGARFAGPVAEHHDGFSMWDSDVNRWNAADMGPKRDIVGELTDALRKKDIKIITSFHHALNILNWYPVMEGTESADPAFGDLYGKFDDQTVALQRWETKVKEVIDQYQPDQIWFDIGLARIPEEYKFDVAAYYYNKAREWGKDVMISKKNNDLPNGIAVLDIERGKMEGMADFTWQTDDCLATNSWGWIQGLELKPASELVHHLIDIVSKNGVLLLNVCPMADGTIPEDQKDLLFQMGDWLEVNGEAIYGTRTWVTHGEGPHLFSQGGTNVRFSTEYTNKDIRFTRNGDTLYAIIMDWPEDEITIQSVLIQKNGKDSSVSMLGHNEELNFSITDNKRLKVEIPRLTPEQRPCDFAYVLKIEHFDIGYHPDVVFDDGRAITLSAKSATLEGGHQAFNLSEHGKSEFVRFMTNSQGRLHWLVDIPRTGRYAVRVRAAPFNEQDTMVLSVGNNSMVFTVPKTESWNKPATIDIGEIEFTNKGIQHVTLDTGNPKQLVKQTMAVWDFQLAPID